MSGLSAAVGEGADEAAVPTVSAAWLSCGGISFISRPGGAGAGGKDVGGAGAGGKDVGGAGAGGKDVESGSSSAAALSFGRGLTFRHQIQPVPVSLSTW